MIQNRDEIMAAAEALAEALQRRYPDIGAEVRDGAVLRTLTVVADLLDGGQVVRFVGRTPDGDSMHALVISSADNAFLAQPGRPVIRLDQEVR